MQSNEPAEWGLSQARKVIWTVNLDLGSAHATSKSLITGSNLKRDHTCVLWQTFMARWYIRADDHVMAPLWHLFSVAPLWFYQIQITRSIGLCGRGGARYENLSYHQAEGHKISDWSVGFFQLFARNFYHWSIPSYQQTCYRQKAMVTTANSDYEYVCKWNEPVRSDPNRPT